MKRLARILLTALTVLSLVLFVAAVGVWAHGQIAGQTLSAWGDPVLRTGYTLYMDGDSIGLQWGTGYRPMPMLTPPGVGRMAMGPGGWDVAGIHFHRWTEVQETYGRKRLPGTYGSTAEFWVTLKWPLILTAILPAAAALRRMLRSPCPRQPDHCNLCPACGYDRRATPDRCPECGTVPADRPHDPHRRHSPDHP